MERATQPGNCDSRRKTSAAALTWLRSAPRVGNGTAFRHRHRNNAMSDPTAGSLRQQLAQHVDKLTLEQSLRAPVAVESQWLAVMETAQGRRSPGTAPVNQPADAPCRLPMKPASAMFMSMTSFPAGPLAKALACTTLLLSLGLSACSSHPGPAVEGRRTLQVLSTSPAQLLENPESGGRHGNSAIPKWRNFSAWPANTRSCSTRVLIICRVKFPASWWPMASTGSTGSMQPARPAGPGPANNGISPAMHLAARRWC